LAASLAAFSLVTPLTASATVLQFTLETPSLSGTDASLLFEFIDGDGAVNNTITVSDFATNGTLGGPTQQQGSVTGALPDPVTLTDTGVFISDWFLQPLTFGSELNFKITLTQKRAAGSLFPDSFAVYLLENDDYFSPALFDTTDPFGLGALFAVDIAEASSGTLSTYTSIASGATATWSVDPVASVPLPSTVWLLGAGWLGGLAARRRGRLHTAGRA